MIDGLLMVLLFLTSVFLILLVLVQRGRGGGLAGAFGGLGGQSAFGTKAGDLFTRVTVVTATFWIILCAVSVKRFRDENSSVLDSGLGRSAASTRASTPAAGGAAPSGENKPGASGPAKTPAAGETAPAAGGTAPAEGESTSAPAAGATETPAEQDAAPPGDTEKGK